MPEQVVFVLNVIKAKEGLTMHAFQIATRVAQLKCLRLHRI